MPLANMKIIFSFVILILKSSSNTKSNFLKLLPGNKNNNLSLNFVLFGAEKKHKT